MDAISRLMIIQARSLAVLANTNGGRWEAEWDATLDMELTRRVNVQHVTSWLAREESDIRYAETSNVRPLLPSDRQQNETPEFTSVSNFIMTNVFGVSVGRNHPMCNVYSSVVCTGKRRKPRINMNYYTTNPLDANHNIYSAKYWNVLLLSRRGRECWSDLPHSRSRDDL